MSKTGFAVLLMILCAALAGCRKADPKRGNMIFETIVVGELGVNCYILADSETKEGIVIDPGADPGNILSAIKANGIKVLYILNTHGHFDHIGGNRKVAEVTGARLMINKEDEPFLSRASKSATMYGLKAEDSPPPSSYLEEGDVISFGRHALKVIHIPGHSPGGSCFYLEKEGLLISGDSLFAESIGRTDLPGGSQAALVLSIRSKLLVLPDETRVFPGHGPSSTIGHEKKFNPYLGG
ncbi:MAG TPA: MBL fold metallo-hydrolase [Geobacteraceae bacterium]|nr:MBL fold metallo-hydrolase [Geobacteraceae bacterium]